MISDISQDLIEEILSRFQPHLGNDYDQLANYGTIYSKTEYSGRSTFVKLQRSLGLSCYTTIGFVHWTSISTLLLRLQSLRALFLKDSQQVDIDEIFHCDGLLLFFLLTEYPGPTEVVQTRDRSEQGRCQGVTMWLTV